MTVPFNRVRMAALLGLSWAVLPAVAEAAPTADQALKLKPIQAADVDYDQPDAAQAAKATIKAEKLSGQTGWVVRDEAGQVLREFVDTNGDNVVDRWSYFRDGVEVYRDIDKDFNGKADQYRWLGTAGTRWGIDKNEDGTIDSWTAISAEEVSAEIVAALREGDAARFNRLLLPAGELKSLGLGAEREKELAAKLAAAPNAFADLASKQRALTAKTKWVNFGGSLPGVVAAGTNGSTEDILAYENVVAMVETDGQHGQVHIGTLVRVDDTWRLIDAPHLAAAGEQLAAGGFYFQGAARRDQPEVAPGGPSEDMQKLLVELEKLDTTLSKTSDEAELAKLNDRRADLLEQIAAESGDDRTQWIRQLADTVSAAVQTGSYSGGVDRLQGLYEKLDQDGAKDLAGYVKFRFLTAGYGEKLRQPTADFQAIQKEWLTNLEDYVKDYPSSPDAAEAMLQLGMAEEFAGQEENAKKWYGEIVQNFPDAPSAKKAAGAKTRLESVGKPIQLKGTAVNVRGGQFDLAQYRGKVVLVHYWATWCEPCKTDLAQLKELQAKYGKGFELVGVSLDSEQQELISYLQKNKLPWPQLYEPGGLDSRLANELGILTLPTMILIDEKGNVANRGVHITELDGELKTLIKR